ncbi:hypothetical protein PTTG_07472 [Puccinia triticina 1-1 BBBD Race 1]|uniref:Large ribosomal subunit protein bL32m n=1 Tax=Puccinia triticina (isolate 1-1 / race 1 (BBBD)) TaxID=630390 RepID=A0A0C4F2Z9_PUCT1|nr:hypothetical protein PTTG_07472 [Puccinia triticina 1-1 BBBD Race 1]WAR53682.1 hypothetical protein PtB15_3B190 [Puccinia triticina]
MAASILSATRNPGGSTRTLLLVLAHAQEVGCQSIDRRITALLSSPINHFLRSIKQNLFQSFSALSSHEPSPTRTSTIDPYFFYDFGGLLKAVPKKKVSHSRKRMRSAHKGLQPNLSLGVCPACGEPKRQHFLCLHCYADKVLERSKSIKTPWEKGITP